MLADETLTQKFMALWATQHGDGPQAAFAATLGREVTEDDIEPVNWIQAEFAARISAVDYAAALAASYAFRRQVQAWWAEGWDLLLTPTLAEPPPTIAEFEPVAGRPVGADARAGRWVAYTPAFNMSGQPAISLPLHWNDAGLPIGVQLVAAYGREDVLDPRRLAARGRPPLGRSAAAGLTDLLVLSFASGPIGPDVKDRTGVSGPSSRRRR